MAAGETDRIAGALLGLAVGDALGAGYEFESSPPAQAAMIGGGSGGVGVDPRRPVGRRGVPAVVCGRRPGGAPGPPGRHPRRVGAARRRACRAFWGARLDEAATTPPGEFAPNGFVVTALQAALAAVWQTPEPAGEGSCGDHACGHFEAALHTAVGIGHDTDTVAAIAGALLGRALGCLGGVVRLVAAGARLARLHRPLTWSAWRC